MPQVLRTFLKARAQGAGQDFPIELHTVADEEGLIAHDLAQIPGPEVHGRGQRIAVRRIEAAEHLGLSRVDHRHDRKGGGEGAPGQRVERVRPDQRASQGQRKAPCRGDGDSDSRERAGAHSDRDEPYILFRKRTQPEERIDDRQQSPAVSGPDLDADLVGRAPVFHKSRCADVRGGVDGQDNHRLAPLEYPSQIVIKGQEHEQDQKKQPDLLCDFPRPSLHGFARDGLDAEEQDVASVQNRYGEQVDEKEVDAHERDHGKEGEHARPEGLAGDLGDENGPPEALPQVQRAVDHLPDPDAGQLDDVPCLGEAVADAREESQALHDDLFGAGDADHGALDLFAEDVLVFGHHRRGIEGKLGAVALDDELNVLSRRVFQYDYRNILPRLHRFALDGNDPVSLHQACGLSGGVLHHLSHHRRDGRDSRPADHDINHDSEQEVEHRACGHDQGTGPQTLFRERAGGIDGRECVSLLGRVLSEHLDIPAERNGRYPVLCLADAPSHEGGPEAERKLQDADAVCLCQEEVSELMDENQNA